jgi:hypothetical protein
MIPKNLMELVKLIGLAWLGCFEEKDNIIENNTLYKILVKYALFCYSPRSFH